MESFFALLQKNVLNTKRWDTREELRIAIVTWIERTYHRRRRQEALGRLTPIEYESIMTPLITEAGGPNLYRIVQQSPWPTMIGFLVTFLYILRIGSRMPTFSIKWRVSVCVHWTWRTVPNSSCWLRSSNEEYSGAEVAPYIDTSLEGSTAYSRGERTVSVSHRHLSG